MADRTNDAALSIRLPRALLRELETRAVADRRPLAAYVRLLLERALADTAPARRTRTA